MDEAILNAYGWDVCDVSLKPYGNGHINDTMLAEPAGGPKVILQKINTDIFRDPDGLMENIRLVTGWIRGRLGKEGQDAKRRVLKIVPTADGKLYFRCKDGGCYRAYEFIEDGVCLEQADTAEEFRESGFAFGQFQGMLSDFPAEKLVETIPDFHNTRKRFLDFKQAVSENRAGRAASVAAETEFAFMRESITDVLEDKRKEGLLPLRVTHNDTKLNNVMLDAKTRKALCVLDLDTVMPGFSVNDFGDSIRFGASTAAEDERDISKVSCDLELFRCYLQGFLAGCGNRLTEEEIRLFPMGAKVMTYESGIRFLGDYLNGDTYFKIHCEDHNLVRARTQFKLVADMEKKWDEMARIVEECICQA